MIEMHINYFRQTEGVLDLWEELEDSWASGATYTKPDSFAVISHLISYPFL